MCQNAQFKCLDGDSQEFRWSVRSKLKRYIVVSRRLFSKTKFWCPVLLHHAYSPNVICIITNFLLVTLQVTSGLKFMNFRLWNFQVPLRSSKLKRFALGQHYSLGRFIESGEYCSSFSLRGAEEQRITFIVVQPVTALALHNLKFECHWESPGESKLENLNLRTASRRRLEDGEKKMAS